MLIPVVKSLGSTTKGVDRVHKKYIIIKKVPVIPLRVHQCLGSRLNNTQLSKQQKYLANEKWTDIKIVEVVFNIIPTGTPRTI
jgi:hypothetical protein